MKTSTIYCLLLLVSMLAGCKEVDQSEVAQPKTNISNPVSNISSTEPQVKYEFSASDYAWMDHYDPDQALAHRIAPPPTFLRQSHPQNTFAHWLRGIPLLPGSPDVLLYNGQRKDNQSAQYAVVNLDVGKKDLQQCADAVIRMRAEYLFARSATEDLHFNFTSGDVARWSEWTQGVRPHLVGSNIQWRNSGSQGDSHRDLMQYLEQVFTYAGTASLDRELKSVPMDELQSGDIFIQGGFPGHAVLVVDVAEHPQTGEKAFLLAQSYMPAQQFHILRNPVNSEFSPWYSTNFSGDLQTPEWTFTRHDLHRFSPVDAPE